MSALATPLLCPPGFSITPEVQQGTVTLRFLGNADMSIIQPLDEYLARMHDEVLRQRVPTVIVDFKQLEFMNSSCFKCFVEWLGKVQELPAAQRYRVVFDSNRDMHWQRRSLNALRCFAMDVVSVDAR